MSLQSVVDTTLRTTERGNAVMRKRMVRTGLITAGALVVVPIPGVVIGSSTNVPVIEVTRTTTATREQVWELWADVPNRTRWDTDLEYAKLDEPFQTGSTGEVKL